MTDERKPETPGMSEVSPKFVDEAEAATATPPPSASVPGDPLLEIIRKYHEADTASDKAYEALDEAEGAARERGIKLPRWDFVRVEAEGRKFDWSKGEIEKAATAEGLHGVNLTTEQRDTYLAQLDELRRKGLNRYKELGLDTLYLENEHCRKAFWKSHRRVCETPAASVGGFVAKVLVLCERWDWGEVGSPLDDLMHSIKPDAERFARKGQRKGAAAEGYSDLHHFLTESAEKGNEKAQSMLDEDFDWRNMSFVRCQGTKTAIQWPPVELTGQDKDLVRGAACVIGNQCALDLIGHIKSHSKNYGGDRLLNVAQEIVKRGEWGGLEIGFFSALGNFMAWGRVQTSADFDAVLTTPAAAGSVSDPVAQIGRDLATIWRQVWRNDDEKVSVEAHGPESTRLERLEFHLADRREALEAMAAEVQAGTLEGVMVQIMLAHAATDVMAASTEETSEQDMRTISKLLYSALAVLERVAGVPREELGGEAYLTRGLDPNVLVAGDEIEGTA